MLFMFKLVLGWMAKFITKDPEEIQLKSKKFVSDKFVIFVLMAGLFTLDVVAILRLYRVADEHRQSLVDIKELQDKLSKDCPKPPASLYSFTPSLTLNKK